MKSRNLLIDPAKLKSHPRNLRTHPRSQIKAIQESIAAFGFTVPLVTDEHLVVLAGEGRRQAALAAGLAEVPVISISGLSEARKRAYLLADNKIAALAGWDRKKLAPEIAELEELLIDDGLDISITGFEAGEIDTLTADFEEATSDAQEPDMPALAERAVSKSGDLWQLSDHSLLCGDACDSAAIKKLLEGRQAAMAFLDVPYNVKVSGIGGRGKTKHREFAMGSGEMAPPEFRAFLDRALRAAEAASASGAVHYICIDWRHIDDVVSVVRNVYGAFLNIAVWVKSNPGQGTFYRSHHEMIVVARCGDEKHTNNVQLGRHGRSRSNVWKYPGVNSFRARKGGDLSIHPTVKPVALVADAIKDCTRRNDIVLDSFCGSGTTILAAERTGRIGYGVEIDPLYVDAAIRRWQAYAKRDAVHAASGLTFDELAEKAGSNSASVRMKGGEDA